MARQQLIDADHDNLGQVLALISPLLKQKDLISVLIARDRSAFENGRNTCIARRVLTYLSTLYRGLRYLS